MKILHLRATNFYGGPERQLHLHAKMAKGSKYEVVVGSFTENGKEPQLITTVQSDNIPNVLFDVNSAYDLRVVKNILTFIKKNNVELVCSHEYRTVVWCFLISRITGVKWYAFSRGTTKDDLKIILYCWLERIFLPFADKIIAVSSAQKQKVRKWGITGTKIAVVENAVDMSLFESITPVDLRARFHFADENIIVISGGRFSAEKGQRFLVEAALSCLKNNPAFRFILFGDGPDLASIRELVADAGRSGEILCPGFEKNMVGCIKGADILVNPSLSEGMPNIVLEAMALGTAVVATDVGGVGELIDSQKNGILVKSGRSEELAAAIELAGSDQEMRERFTIAAQEKVRNGFSFQIQYEKLQKVYNEAVG